MVYMTIKEKNGFYCYKIDRVIKHFEQGACFQKNLKKILMILKASITRSNYTLLNSSFFRTSQFSETYFQFFFSTYEIVTRGLRGFPCQTKIRFLFQQSVDSQIGTVNICFDTFMRRINRDQKYCRLTFEKKQFIFGQKEISMNII